MKCGRAKRRTRDACAAPDDWPFGPRFMVFSVTFGAWYAATLAGHKEDKVRVRYAGWGPEDDEWLHLRSDRFAVEAGGSKIWRPVPGATGAFARVVDGSLPSGQLLASWPPAPRPAVRRVVKSELQEGHKLGAAGKHAKIQEVQDILSIRAFGAAHLSLRQQDLAANASVKAHAAPEQCHQQATCSSNVQRAHSRRLAVIAAGSSATRSPRKQHMQLKPRQRRRKQLAPLSLAAQPWNMSWVRQRPLQAMHDGK